MIKSSDLSWIVVSDIKKARKFFTEVIGLKESSFNDDFGWIELQGSEGGAYIGVAQEGAEKEMQLGKGAVITLTVDNIEKTRKEFQKKKVKLIGDLVDVPGYAKMQLFSDLDGNMFQLIEIID